ncbi:MAG: helicase [Anaerocolumna sp.]|jgi:superfamily II DNA/RNA helicase|nr:helicase [Anaerocolumna sp.]
MDKNNFQQFKISEVIVDALTSLGYTEPTPVQKQIIPLALDRKDIIVKSQTGSGKTAAYGIPICEGIDWMENKPQALILVPTRELAVQVKEDISNIGRLKRIKVSAVYGRQPIATQVTDLKQKTHAVVGTPGRVKDHIERGTLNISQINYLVIDEADEMLNMGFIEQVSAIIKLLPEERVTMLFSATMPDEVKDLALKYMIDPVDSEINSERISTDNIKHFLYQVEEEDKFTLLTDVTVVENPDSCIIFCRTKERVDMLYDRLRDLKYCCDKIHGGLEQKDRLKAMNRFRRGEFRYLIATNLAARGIDIDDITLVLNYDIPFEKEGYVHRTGRTGRAGGEGRAITFVTSHEERYLREIEEYLGMEITVLTPPSKEEIFHKNSAFTTKMNTRPVAKEEKGALLNQQIMRLRINSGKKKNLRATTLVGIISNIEGVKEQDIGIITIMDTLSYVEILNGKGPLVMKAMKNITIKGKTMKVTVVLK